MADTYLAGPMIEATAGAALSGHKAIAIIDGEAIHADKDTAAHRGMVRGITVGAAVDGATAFVQTYGPMIEPSWTWTPNAAIYVGANGALTQTAPSSGFLQQIAVADSATRIFIDPQPAIALS
jgi:hypothetical protein